MARRLILFAALLLLLAGCGESTPPSLTGEGLRALRSGKYDEAITTCSRAISEDPKNAEAYLYRGRAYQFRNAMGDPQRAIDDFGEAIRLAPNSSDAYYSRAILYRDLGQRKLAEADEQKAREADGNLQNIFPSLSEPTDIASADTADAPADSADLVLPSDPMRPEVLPTSEDEKRKLFEELKERFEPRRFAADEPEKQERETPIERYQRMSREALEQPDDSWASSEAFVLPAPLAPLPGPAQPSLSPDANALDRRPARPAPTSPFMPPTLDSLSGPSNPLRGRPSYRPVQSPFGGRAPAPTGFGVQPANPFQQQPPPRRTVSPQATAPKDPTYSNPAVRPGNPREYLP